MDTFFAASTPEASAHHYIVENAFTWQTEQPAVDEALIAASAAYRAIERYLSGSDLYLPPRTRSELESILRRYSYDAIHNQIAHSRSPLQTGGYSRVCHRAETSIRSVLSTGDNTLILLSLHRVAASKHASHDVEAPATRSIITG